MMRLQYDISYDEWLAYLFDHPAPSEAGAGAEWYRLDDAPRWSERGFERRAVDYLTRLFEEPEAIIARYTSDQIGVGLYYLANPSCSDHFFVVTCVDVPLESRVRLISAIESLYSNCFARICQDKLCEDTKNYANHICFMFWDVCPLHAWTRNESHRRSKEMLDRESEYLALEEACLTVLDRTVALDHTACQEGALHGLGEWHRAYPARVEAAIDHFLATKSANLRLLKYAKSARRGAVL